MIRARIIGCGAFLPDNAVSNDELAKKVDTSDEWIRERTGIRQRYIAGEGETTSTLFTFPSVPISACRSTVAS